MHRILTFVETISSLAGIDTAATYIYVRMIVLTNTSPFWYWFNMFLQVLQFHDHVYML